MLFCNKFGEVVGTIAYCRNRIVFVAKAFAIEFVSDQRLDSGLNLLSMFV